MPPPNPSRPRPHSRSGSIAAWRMPGGRRIPNTVFDVLAYRLEHEYGAKVSMDRMPFAFARWVSAIDPNTKLDTKVLEARRVPLGVTDVDGHVVALLRDQWELLRIKRDNDGWLFAETAPLGPAVATA